MGRYTKIHSNYVLTKPHQNTNVGKVWVRDWVTIGGQHQIEKGKKPYYTDTNFLFTDNSYPSYKKKYNYGKWVAQWNYDNVKDATDEVNAVKVNRSSNDIRDFAYYGSAVELVKSSVTNIINHFPATVTLSTEDMYVPNASGGYDLLDGYHQLNNPFGVDFVHTLSEKEKKENNIYRFFLESFQYYTLNGSEILECGIENRRFVQKTITDDRTVKDYVTEFNIVRTKTYDKDITPFTLKKNGVELVDTNNLVIDDFGYSNNITDVTTIKRYNKNEGKLYVGSTGYAVTDSSILLKTSHRSDIELTASGYGFKKSGNNIAYDGKDINITVNTGKQNLSNITLRPGYTYTIGETAFTVETMQTVTPVYTSNNGERKITFKIDGADTVFDVSSYLSEYSDTAVKTNASFSITGVNEAEESVTVTFSSINVNNSKSIGTLSLDGTYNFIVSSNSSNGEYLQTATALSFTSKTGYFNQSSKKIVLQDGTVICDVSSSSLTDSNFIFSILKKSPDVVLTTSILLNPCYSITLEEGNYFIQVNDRRINWQTTCYKTSDVPKSILNVNRRRLYNNNIEFIAENDSILWQVPVTSRDDKCYLYIENKSQVSYSFMQSGNDEQVADFVSHGCEVVPCRPNEWLPSSSMSNGWDKYVKDCSDCGDGECYVSILLSSDLEVEGNKNMPLYTVTIKTDSETIKLEAYILNSEVILITTADEFTLRCKKEVFDEFFNNLDGFEKQLLTLDSKPLYKNSFLTPIETELSYKYVYRDYTWPSTPIDTVAESNTGDGFGYAQIDISSESYFDYLSRLIDMATIFDELWCDNLYRNMTHESIKNFDWTYTREYTDGDEQDNIDGGNQIMKLLRIYGRAFDDLKRLADGIGFVTKNTYDGFNNQPDAEISDRLENSGWEITSTIPIFQDTEHGYINKNSGSLINKKTYDELTQAEKDEFEDAYIETTTAQIIGQTAYDALDETVKPKFKYYYPNMDLSDVVITQHALYCFEQDPEENPFEECINNEYPTDAQDYWYPTRNPNDVDTSRSDIEFMRRLILSSNRIFNTKGTKHAIDMVMALFGYGENDYSLTEAYYRIDNANLLPFDEKPKTEEIEGGTDDETDEEHDMTWGDLIESINYYKDYPKNYDDMYSGVPLNDYYKSGRVYYKILEDESLEKVDKATYDGLAEDKRLMKFREHLIVPFYTQKRMYDGDFIFESKGGWAQAGSDGQYTETLSYLHVVSDFSELLETNPSSLNEGDIYYVSDISTYSEYVNTLPENMSHFFALKKEIVENDEIIQVSGKFNPQLPESWENVDMQDLENENTKKAIYLDSIVSTNIGNNPHTGYGAYDGGGEFKSYMEKPFKYGIDEYLFDAEWLDEAEKVKFDVEDPYETDEDAFTGDTLGIGGNKVKVLIDYGEDSTEKDYDGNKVTDYYYLNRKLFLFKSTLHFNDEESFELHKKYFMDVIVNYLMQVIPSTTILILDFENSESGGSGFAGQVDHFGDKVNVSLSYTNDINAAGTNTSSPILSYSLTAYMKDGSIRKAPIKSAQKSFNGSGEGTINANGVVSGNNVKNTNEQKRPFMSSKATVTCTVEYKDGDEIKTKEVSGTSENVVIYQVGKEIIEYGEVTVTLSYTPTILEADGIGSATPTVTYSQTVTYSDGTTGTIESGGSVSYSGPYTNSTTGIVSGVGRNSTDSEITIGTVTASVVLNGVRGTSNPVTIKQKANEITEYGNVTVNLSYETRLDVDGSGVSRPIMSYSQTVVYGNGTTATITSGASSIVYSKVSGRGTVNSIDGSVSGVGENTATTETVCTRVKVTVTMPNPSDDRRYGEAEAEVKQQANSGVRYSNLEILNFTYLHISSAGGSVSPVLEYRQKATSPDGSWYYVYDGGEVSYEPQGPTYPGTLDGDTGVVTIDAPWTGTREPRPVKQVKVTVKLHGQTATKASNVFQDPPAPYYSEIVIDLFKYGMVALNGEGTYNPQLEYHQTVTYGDGGTEDITRGAEVTYVSLNGSNGYVHDASLGRIWGVPANTGPERTIDNVKVTVKLNGKEATATTEVKQEGVDPGCTVHWVSDDE